MSGRHPRAEPPPTLPATDPPLFRSEVMVAGQAQWLGHVLLEPRLSSTVFAGAAVLTVAALIALLFFGTFTRKARVNGWLMPQHGLARVFAPHSGVVSRIHAQEGLKVAKGTPLVALSAEVQSEALGATREEIVRQLTSRRDSTVAAKATQDKLFAQQGDDLRRRLEALGAELEHLAQEVELQRARLRLSERALAREREMRARDLITLTRLVRTEQEHIDHAARLQVLERSRIALGREHAQVQATLRELPMRREMQISEIERAIATLEQELAEAEARRQIVVVAPQDGVVTAIQTELGGNANPNAPLMSIVPEGAVLEAQLFSPSRAVGFVRPGQRVLLRYQSFPYQKFGSYEGVVVSVSRSSISPSELPPQLAGLTNLYDGKEPFYRVTVRLAQQAAFAYDKRVPLQPGMQLEADILIDTRRLIEWVLDPLYTLTGKLHG